MTLPRNATQPFCASEVEGSVVFNAKAGFWHKLLQLMGPGFLIAVGYMDPGNWATDIEAGSRFGYDLLFVVGLSSFAAIFLQCLSMRLGLATGKDLARLTREQSGRLAGTLMWIMAEISIVACDLAEVLGGALAFHLLLGVPLLGGVVLTILDTIMVLGLKGRNFRTLEAIVIALIATVGVCYFVELALIKPYWPDVFAGFVPTLDKLKQPDAMYLTVGIIGATIMPHNLYLHSSIILTRVAKNQESKKQLLKFSTLDTGFSLFLALLINCAILMLAAGVFHKQGQVVADIGDAYHLLHPLVGSVLAAPLFGVALLASGQSSTFTGTVAGQIILQGFMNLKIPCWQRRLITRSLALIPALLGVWFLGDRAVGKLLVWSQIILSLQLPFALFPLIRQSSNRSLMGSFKISSATTAAAWIVFAVIVAANISLLIML